RERCDFRRARARQAADACIRSDESRRFRGTCCVTRPIRDAPRTPDHACRIPGECRGSHPRQCPNSSPRVLSKREGRVRGARRSEGTEGKSQTSNDLVDHRGGPPAKTQSRKENMKFFFAALRLWRSPLAFQRKSVDFRLMNLRRLFLYLLIASVGLSAVIGIVVILFGNFGQIEVRVLMTTLTVTVTSIFGLACGAYLETGRGRYLPLAGIAFSIISALMSFLIIWNVLDDSEPFIKSFLTGVVLAASCSHLSLLSLARLDSRFAWTRVAALVCVSLLSLIFLYILWFEPKGDSDLIYRVLG